MLVFEQYTITVERQGRRQWFRLRMGQAVIADNLPSMAALERELARYGLALADFREPQ